MKIKGKIIKGYGQAQHTLKMQKVILEQYIPNFEKYYLKGTINIRLEKPSNFHPDIETQPLKWDTRQVPVTEEKFGFVKIKFEIIGKDNDLINAWIYIASKSPHYADPSYLGILAPYIAHHESPYCYIIIENK